jgi:hypothetical protein
VRSAPRAEPPAADAAEPIVYCTAHPKVETGLRCSRCDTPICPRCLVMTPVGARCKACARLSRLPMFVAGPRHVLLAVAAGLGSALLGAVALLFIPSFGFLTLLLYAGFGYGVGEAVSLATNRKRATALAWIAAACAGAGALVAFVHLPGLLAVVAVGLAGVIAWGRVRRL